MKALLFEGPPGSGKTTLINQIVLRSRQLKAAIIYNDEGETMDRAVYDSQDGGVGARVVPMTSGCFGCKDEASTRQILEELARTGEYEWVILEPLGFIEGSEVPKLLASCGVETHVITLLDVANIDNNHALGCVPSQLKAATAAVGLTCFPSDVDSVQHSALESALDYVAEHAQREIFVFLVNLGEPLPDEVIERLQVVEVSKNHKLKCGHNHQHGQSCDHHHNDHNHGSVMYSFRLRPEVESLSNLVEAFAPFPEIYRIKGGIDGYKFDAKHGEWSRSEIRDTRKFVTFYSRTPIDTAAFGHLIDPEQDPYEGKDTRSILRSSDYSIEETVKAIRRMLELSPKEVVVSPYGPVTNLETLELANELRKRPNVPDDVKAEAISAKVRYYLSAVSLYRPDSVWVHASGADERKRNIAIGICWFAHCASTMLSPEILRRAEELKADGTLNRLLTEGLAGLENNNSDTNKALNFAKEIGECAQYLQPVSAELLAQIYRCAQLPAQVAVQDVWAEVLQKIDKKEE